MKYVLELLEEKLSSELEKKATADLFIGGNAGCDRNWFKEMITSFEETSRKASERIPQLKEAIELYKNR